MKIIYRWFRLKDGGMRCKASAKCLTGTIKLDLDLQRDIKFTPEVKANTEASAAKFFSELFPEAKAEKSK